jgi:hypothetical protein
MSTPHDTTTQSDSRRVAGAWVALVLAAIVTIAAICVVDFFVMWGQSSTCNEAPDPDDVRAGQLTLLGVLAIAALPWGLGCLMARRRTPVLVCGLIAVAPAALFLLNGLSTDAWVGGFCF